MTEFTASTFVKMWKRGLVSSSKTADDFLGTWATTGFLESLRTFKRSESPLFSGRKLSPDEKGALLSQIEDDLKQELTQSGPHRQQIWEKGWSENLEQLRKSGPGSPLIPGYFERSRYLRLADDFLEVDSPQAEPTSLGFLVDIVLEGLSLKVPYANIHEFGCGTGIHVSRLAKLFPEKTVTGYDWASSSVQILRHLKEQGLSNVGGHLFDFFGPDYDVKIGDKDLILTVAALEQVGADFSPFMEFLEKKSSGLIVNIEPIEELLDLQDSMGALSAEYFRRRNYLAGFYSQLLELELEGRLEVLHSGRSGLGSLYIEGYSIVIWRFV